MVTIELEKRPHHDLTGRLLDLSIESSHFTRALGRVEGPETPTLLSNVARSFARYAPRLALRKQAPRQRSGAVDAAHGISRARERVGTVDNPVLEAGGRKSVGVRVPPLALLKRR